MAKFIQIEELVYGRLPHVSKTDWINMLVKGGMLAAYTTFKDDYLLLEYSDYRFDGNKMISSERFHYNIDYSTYDGVQNAEITDDTDEIQLVRYDRRTDRYFVRYAHYLPSNEPAPDTSSILSEADIPSSRLAVQAPAEKQIDTPVAPRPVQPTPQPTPAPKPQPAPQPVYPPQDAHSHWRKSTLKKLGDLYQKGYSAKEIQEELKCSIDNIYYHLEHTLGYKTPFDPSVWLPRAKGGTSKPVVTQNPQPQPQPQTKPDRPVKEKHKGRYTWDGEIILTHLYKHPGATTSEIASAHKSLTRRDINQCLNNYFSGYVEKDKRTGGYRLNQRGINEIRPYIESLGSPEITLQDYQAMLQRLHRSKNAKGHIAPHKVILMLAIISYFKKHIVRVMEIDNDMKVFFMDYWRKHVHSDEWTSNIYMPWEHMGSEPFWHWVTEDSTTEAYLDDDLYYMIHHDKSARSALRRTLIDMLQ